jgi:hypothetical protein
MGRLSSLLVAVFLVALTVWSPTPAQVMAASVSGVLQKALAEERLSSQESAEIEEIIQEARNDGLPVAPLAAKVEEGLAKRVPGHAIVRALGSMSADYAFARDALMRTGAAPTPEAIADTGDSLRLGLSRPELSALAARRPTHQVLATAARTRACLNAVDFPAKLSDEILRRGMAAGSLTPAWTQLFRVVQRARKAGLPDSAVAEAASRILAEGNGIAALLQELGFTTRDTRQAPAGDDR